MDPLQTALSAFDNPGQAAPAKPEPAPQTSPTTPEPAPAQQEPQQQTPPATPEPAGSQTPPSQKDPAQQAQTPSAQTPEQIFQGSKANQTFAQMRVENTQMRRTIGQLANILGVTAIDQIEPALQALNNKILEYQSQQQNIPLELLKRLDQTEQRNAQYEQDRLQQQAVLSFQKVKDTFGIDDKKLAEFAMKLNEEGKNPFTTPMDLVKEYRTIYFDEILKQHEDNAVAAIEERQRKAQTQASKPVSISSPSTPQTPAGGIDGLRSVLAQLDGK